MDNTFLRATFDPIASMALQSHLRQVTLALFFLLSGQGFLEVAVLAVRSERCLNPHRVDELNTTIAVSDFAVMGVVRHTTWNDTNVNLILDRQRVLPRWIFGSPRGCCEKGQYKLTYWESGQNDTGRGCWLTDKEVETLRSHAKNDTHDLIFFMRAYNNYTEFVPSATPLQYDGDRNYTRLRNLTGKCREHTHTHTLSWH